MGWWPTKLCILLNVQVMLGYAMIDAVVAGQILSAVSSDGKLTVEVGIVITAILTWLVTTFGIKIFIPSLRTVRTQPLNLILYLQFQIRLDSSKCRSSNFSWDRRPQIQYLLAVHWRYCNNCWPSTVLFLGLRVLGNHLRSLCG
jgi:purine-cytosine permease-like protein